MEVEIVLLKYDENFTKRSKDIKRMTWFSFPNDLMTHPDFFDITGDEFKAFMWCISVCSKCNSSRIRMNIDHACHILKMKKDSFHSMIEKLKGKQLDVVCDQSATAYGQNVASTEHNITEHNITKIEGLPSISTVVEFSTPVAKKSAELILIKNEKDLDAVISENVKRRWSELYPDQEFLRREVLKAINWCETNPKKKPKTSRGWTLFLSSWFERGWTRHVKNIQTNNTTISESHMEKILGGEA